MTVPPSDKIYRQLQVHLDKLPIGFPQASSGSDIRLLRAFFTPEDAQYALTLGFLPRPLLKLYKKAKKSLNISREEFQQRLDSMALRGLIFSSKGATPSETTYMNAPVVVGFYEFNIDNINQEKAAALEEYMKDVFIQEFTATGIPQMRTIPVEITFTPEHPILAYDDVWQIVDQMKPPYVVAECICTQEKEALGGKCQHELTKRCICNSKWYLENGHGTEITKDELVALIKRAQTDGLVLQPSTYQKGAFLCLCCSCCCGILTNIKTLPAPAQSVWTNCFSRVDSTKCKACGMCVRKCPMTAITIQENAVVNLDRCIGCGVCVASCPEKAIVLQQKPNKKEPPETATKMYVEIWKNRFKMSPMKRKLAMLKDLIKM